MVWTTSNHSLQRTRRKRRAVERHVRWPLCALRIVPTKLERNAVSKLLVRSFSVSIDGYGAGPSQDLQNPLGVGGPELFDWFFHTRTWQRMHGNQDGETGVDDDLAAHSFVGIGAWILGRNMFGPVRGPWPDGSAGSNRRCNDISPL